LRGCEPHTLSDLSFLLQLAPEHGQKVEAREWMLVEKKHGAALPESFGEIPVRYREEEVTVPGTDRQEYRDLVYGTNQVKEGETGVQLHLQKILPGPKPETDIHKIIQFTPKRHDELLQFRRSIDDLEDKLAKSQDQEEERHN
jgi:uncharacterized protein DUF6236